MRVRFLTIAAAGDPITVDMVDLEILMVSIPERLTINAPPLVVGTFRRVSAHDDVVVYRQEA